ncbi:amastin-like surface protein-like protein [Leishmania mexicana MHOM/GT/2001/U1103]|uniref:Amastin-like surface protein-like protein n=1 Tax=Leishmania mexicana (strain MHOM/GT/2001/U1103) TaxID=929439 RepID=E9ASP7_LEIMU|nr:amastin-like surface protein-like protein [Leishmania mexicana MHOM/GT/2001/U1103]CBZ25971.1 amastin-like surface protein-like protein [Leishmania mexicana MHOM/GT/2001/U1103]
MPAFNLASLRSCLLGAVADNVLLLVYIILQFIAFFFVLVATPIDMFRRKDVLPDGTFTCYTLWGFKSDCYFLHYLFTINEEFSQCPALLHRFRAAQAFAIISILVYGGAFVASFAILYGYSFIRWVCLALNIVGIVTLCVVWAAMAVTYNSNDDSQCLRFKNLLTYGAGFVLFVIAWILDIINTVILLLPCTVTDSDEDKHTKRPAAEE